MKFETLTKRSVTHVKINVYSGEFSGDVAQCASTQQDVHGCRISSPVTHTHTHYNKRKNSISHYLLVTQNCNSKHLVTRTIKCNGKGDI